MKSLIEKYWILVLLFLMCLTPALWFLGRGEVIINGLDTNFPLDPIVWFGRRLFVWNETINAGVDASSSTSGAFFHLVQVIPYYLRFSLQQTQIVSLIFWFSATVFSAYFYIRSMIPGSKVAQILFVVLYSFNIYLFNTWENVKVSNLALVVGLPLFLGLIQYYRDKKIGEKALIPLTAIFTIVCAGAGINPAYYIALIFSVVIYSIVNTLFCLKDRVKIKRVWIGTTLMVLISVLVSLYWILPLLNYLFFTSSASNLEELGFTNWLSSLSEHTSLLNVIRLQGAWDWYTLDGANLPIYIPYAVNYFYNPLFILFSFAVPLLVVISFIIRNSQKSVLYAFLGVLSLVGIFLGAGLHPPTGSLYSFLLKIIPYLSFFRSPWYIFTPYLVISFASLVALLFDSIDVKYGMINVAKGLKTRLILMFCVLVFIVGHLLYSYPLVSGKIFRPGRGDSFYVEFPEYIYDAGEWLESRDSGSRVITYPEDQLEAFEWGYRGTESILGLYTSQEVIAPSFVFASKEMRSILSEFYSLIKTGNYDSALNLVEHLNVDTVMVKKDASTNFKQVDIPNSDRNIFGEWVFYSKPMETNKVSTAYRLYANYGDDVTLSKALANFERGSFVYLPGDSELEKIRNIDELSGGIWNMDNTTFEDDPANNIQIYKIESEGGMYTLMVEKKGFGGSSISISSESFSLDGSEVINSDAYLLVRDINIPVGKHLVRVEYPLSENLISKADVLDADLGINLRDENLPNDPDILVAYNDEPISTFVLPIKQFDPYKNYLLKYDSRQLYGSSPTVNLWQKNERTDLSRFQYNTVVHNDWDSSSHLIRPAPIDSVMNLIIEMKLYNDEKKGKTYFDNIEFRRVYDNKVLAVKEADLKLSPQEIKYEKVNPVLYSVEVKASDSPYILTFLENYSADWELRSEDESIRAPHFKLNGYANAWYLPGNSNTQTFEIYYKGQDFYKLGTIISLVAMIVCLSFPIVYRLYENKK